RGPLPALSVRNMLERDTEPMSNTRAQVGSPDGLTQVDTVQSPSSPSTTPSGSVTYESVPHRSSAVPIFPGWRGPSGVQPDVAAPSVHWTTAAPGSVLIWSTPRVR